MNDITSPFPETHMHRNEAYSCIFSHYIELYKIVGHGKSMFSKTTKSAENQMKSSQKKAGESNLKVIKK